MHSQLRLSILSILMKLPRTVCRMTDAGRETFLEYVEALKEYVTPSISIDNQCEQQPPGGLVPC